VNDGPPTTAAASGSRMGNTVLHSDISFPLSPRDH
jgi:hypothetical protein